MIPSDEARNVCSDGNWEAVEDMAAQKDNENQSKEVHTYISPKEYHFTTEE